MSYKSILQQTRPTVEALENYYTRKCRDIEYQVRAYYENLKRRKIEEEKEKLERKMIRKLASRLKNEHIQYRSAIKSLKSGNIEIKKKPRTLNQIRSKAYGRFQKWRRLDLADRQWMIRTMDTLKYVRRNQKGIVSWHYRSKHNHANLWFEPLNVRPIHKQTNRMQWDQPWYYWRDNLIEKIWQEKFDELEALSKQNDIIIRDRKYWEEMEEVWYNNLQELIEERKSKWYSV